MQKITFFLLFTSSLAFSQITTRSAKSGFTLLTPNGIISQKESLTNDTTNIAIGSASLSGNSNGRHNVAIGLEAMKYSNGTANIAIGSYSLQNAGAVSGHNNVAIGYNSLNWLTSGRYNTSIGEASLLHSNGSSNAALGAFALNGIVMGNGNTAVGYKAGDLESLSSTTSYSGNVFLGYQAGFNSYESNKLYIANSSTDSPLIWGDFYAAKLGFHGKVGIGTKNPITNLQVYQVAGHSQILLNNSNIGATLTDGLSLISDTNGDAHILNKENKPLHFGANNFASYMSVFPAGEVGVGLLGFLPSAHFHLHETEAGQATKFKISNAFSNISTSDGFVFEYNNQGEMLMNNLEIQNIHINSNPNNSTPEIFVAGSSRVGIGTNSPATKLEVNGFTKLGSDAPAIKIKKLTTTTGSNDAAGNLTTIETGVTATKIIGIQALVEYGPGQYVPSSYVKNGGYEFNFATNNLNEIEIFNISGNSYNIYSKPIKILITYEE